MLASVAHPCFGRKTKHQMRNGRMNLIVTETGFESMQQINRLCFFQFTLGILIDEKSLAPSDVNKSLDSCNNSR